MCIENIIEIRSNITESVCRFVEAEALRLKREEEERKARWEREQKLREEETNKWKEEHPNLEKYTYCSYYCRNTFNYEYGGSCKIHFYEWSNINSEPIVFNYYPYFYRFLDECKILLSYDENCELKSVNSVFVTCKPGCKELIIGKTYDELRDKYNNILSLSNVLSSVPEVI